MSETMDQHAVAFLEEAESWGWPQTLCVQESGKTSPSSKFRAIMPKLLSGFIVQSHTLGGSLEGHFWKVLGECDPKLKENIETLRQTATATLPGRQTLAVLFDGVDPISINFDPVLKLAEDLFKNLGIAFQNPGRCECDSGSEHSVSDVATATENLLVLAAEGGWGKGKQVALKTLSFRRDGQSCLLTSFAFAGHGRTGVKPRLAHIIPNSVHGKPDTIKTIGMFAGVETADIVLQQLNTLENIVNLEANAHDFYDDLAWGIEALEDNGKVKYFYRRLDGSDEPGPHPICLRDKEEIKFGRGTESTRLGPGPNPVLCNLQLAVARVMKMSGAAEVISQWKEDGDDGDIPHVYIASADFCDILTAKLLLSGQALIA